MFRETVRSHFLVRSCGLSSIAHQPQAGQNAGRAGATEHAGGGLSPGGLFSSQHDAGRCCFCDQAVLLVRYVAFNVAERATALQNRSFRLELCLPDWAKKVNFELDCGKRFVGSQRACERDAHRSVSYVAKNPAMQGSHRIRMLRSRREDDGGPSLRNVFYLESDQTRDGNIIILARSRKSVLVADS
jgi:hypothetical protein